LQVLNRNIKQVAKNPYCVSITLILLVILTPKLLALEVRQFSRDEFRLRYYELIEELRCPKCQNQNLADSNSVISVDLRGVIHSMLEDGKSDDEITEFLVDRYGGYVRYNPQLNSKTLILWFTPVFLFILGVIVIFYIYLTRSGVENNLKLKSREKLYLDDLVINNSKTTDSSETKK
jgi:cytochrome c-type biogenesis protein CcmH